MTARYRSREPQFFTMAEVAELYRVDIRIVRKLITEGRLPAYHVGDKIIRIKRDDAEKMLVPVNG